MYYTVLAYLESVKVEPYPWLRGLVEVEGAAYRAENLRREESSSSSSMQPSSKFCA